MRTNFYDLLAKKEFSVREEYNTLWYLFAEEGCVAFRGCLTSLRTYVNEHCFRKLPCRGSFTHIESMMNELGLRKYVTDSIETLLLFCEFLLAVLPKEKIEKNSFAATQRCTIVENIYYILEKTNHEIALNLDRNPIIVEKNKSAKLAAEIVDNTAVAFDIIEYNHFALKGHLSEKRKILLSIHDYIEPILKSKSLSNAGYRQLESNAGFVFNNFHIRHNNKEGSKAQEYILSLSDDKLEEWYDNAYELALSVIIISNCQDINNEIDSLKAKYHWKT